MKREEKTKPFFLIKRPEKRKDVAEKKEKEKDDEEREREPIAPTKLQKIENYEIKKGDTLWAISRKYGVSGINCYRAHSLCITF